VVQGVPAAGFILFSFPQELNGQGSNFYLCLPDSADNAPSIQALLSAVGSPEDCDPGTVAVSYTSFMTNLSHGGLAVASILTHPAVGWLLRTPPAAIPFLIKAAPYIVVGVTVWIIIDSFGNDAAAAVAGLASVCYPCLLAEITQAAIRIAISFPRPIPLPLSKRDFPFEPIQRFQCCATGCFSSHHDGLSPLQTIACYNHFLAVCMGRCETLGFWVDLLTGNLCSNRARVDC